MLPRNRIDNVARHHQRARLGKRIHEPRGRIGNNEHVALINRRPTAYARTINSKTVFKRPLIQHGDRIRDMVTQPRQIGKSQIYLPGIVLSSKL